MEQTKDTRSNGIKVAIIALVLLLLLAVAGTLAYLTDNDTATNKFSLATLDIELTETNWAGDTDSDSDGIPNAAENVVPNQTIAKNPQVYNGTIASYPGYGSTDSYTSTPSTTDAWVIMEVKVPVANVTVCDASGVAENTSANKELFTLEGLNSTDWTADSTVAYYQSDGTTATADLTDTDTAWAVHTYYSSSKVTAGSTTDALFTGVKLINLAVGVDATAVNKQVDVNAYGIQASNGTADGFASGSAAWTAYKTQHSIS